MMGEGGKKDRERRRERRTGGIHPAGVILWQTGFSIFTILPKTLPEPHVSFNLFLSDHMLFQFWPLFPSSWNSLPLSAPQQPFSWFLNAFQAEVRK